MTVGILYDHSCLSARAAVAAAARAAVAAAARAAVAAALVRFAIAAAVAARLLRTVLLRVLRLAALVRIAALAAGHCWRLGHVGYRCGSIHPYIINCDFL